MTKLPPDHDVLVTTAAVTEILQCTRDKFEKIRVGKGFPLGIKIIGSSILYWRSEILGWLEANRVSPDNPAPAAHANRPKAEA